MNQARGHYPSDLTDQQWEIIRNVIPPARTVGRPRKTNERLVVNAVLYLTRTGCAWRYLPREFPPWRTVYEYFVRWKWSGTWRQIHLSLATQVRVNSGRKESPSTVIIDAQSVKAHYGEKRGWDGFKKVQGRKREILVDTLGILWGANVHSANLPEQKGAFDAISSFPSSKSQPSRLLGDHSYSKAPFDGQLFSHWRIWPETKKSKKPLVKDHRGIPRRKLVESNLKPQRWIVERSFAWLNHSRRLSRDYEKVVSNSETLLYISQIPILLNRLVFQPP